MTTTTQAPANPAGAATRIAARLARARRGVTITAEDKDVVLAALRLYATYETTRPGRVRFIADAWAEAGAITVASTDPRIPGGFITSVRGAAAVAIGRVLPR